MDIQEAIKKYDTQNVYGSIVSLPDQCLHAWEDANKVEVPEYYKDINNVIMCGMGGSGLGARVIESLFAGTLKYPFYRIHDYHLPGFADIHSLVICSAYSGETEEPIQITKEAIEKRCKWMAIASGNLLIKLAQEHNVPYYQIEPKFNPSNQPRLAIGYSIIGQLVLASKIGLFSIEKPDIERAVHATRKVRDINIIENMSDNPALSTAFAVKNKILIYVSAQHLVGAAHTANNQHNENAKNLSFDFVIPELNHHLMEGLKHPANNKDNLYFIFIDSDLYSNRIRQRFEITKDVVSQNNIQFSSFKPSSNDKLSQVFEVIQFAGFLNFYLSMLYEQDPAPIPWVDYFKTQLGQPLGK